MKNSEDKKLTSMVLGMLREMEQTQIEEDKKEYYPINADGSVTVEIEIKPSWHPDIGTKVIS